MLHGVVLFHLFLTCFITVFCGSVREFIGQQILEMNDKILPNNLLKITYTTSKLKCAVECVSEPTCEWVSYNQSERTCRHHSISLELVDIGTQAIVSNGWRSYTFVEPWCPIQKGFVFSRSSGLCYKAIPGRVSCTTSINVCVSEGARPLVIDSVEKQNFIVNILENRLDMDSMWMDAFLSPQGQWEWYNSGPVSNTYTNWDIGNLQPDNEGVCVAIKELYGYKWHDYEHMYNCDTICEVRRPN